MGIYEIRNVINNKYYIGSSKNIKKRWWRHKNDLKNNNHNNIHLQRAWNKYGKNNFIFKVIEECKIEDLLSLEQKYLDLKPEYNIGITSSGGDNLTNNPNKLDIINRIKHTLNEKISNMTEEERKLKWGRNGEDNPNWKGGITHNYCSCGKEIAPGNKYCSDCRPRSGENNPFFNKHHTDETKNKLSEQRKGKYNGTQNIKFTIDGIEYFSLGDAHNKLNIPIPTILFRLKSKNLKFENYKYLNN